MPDKCEVCGTDISEGGKLCDYRVGQFYACKMYDNGHSTGECGSATCDKKMCPACAIEVWKGFDLCPEHAGIVERMLRFRLHKKPCGEG